MSKHRTLRDAMGADPALRAVKKNADGCNLCRYCSTVVQPPRRAFCSAECVHQWKIRSHSGYARGCVRKRDKSICQLCKRDCLALRKKLNAMPGPERMAEAARLGIPKHRAYRKSLWDVDHIIPVSEGGGSCGLENLRTLCLWCHRQETTKLQKRLAEQRRVAKGNTDTQPETNCSNDPDSEEKKQSE